MPATVSIRRSLEPLAAALIAIGLVHLLVGFIVLNILPEIHKQAMSKASTKLLWYAPSDFLLNKKVEVETPVVVQSSDFEKASALAVSPDAMPAVSKSVQAVPPPMQPPAPPVAISPPSKPAEKSLAEVLQTNRGLMPQALDAGFMALTPMPLTINSVEPSVVSPPNIAPPAPPAMPPPAPPVMAVAPPMPTLTPAVIGSPPVTAPSAPTILGDQKEANKYITLSAILPPGKAPAKPRENKPVLNLLDVANLNANERAEDVEAGGADMGPVEKALQQSILKEWTAPPAQSVPPSQRRATMEISILRDGSIADASMKTASGSSLLDASIRQAAERLKKIPVTLPSNFPKERYELRVNFQIE